MSKHSKPNRWRSASRATAWALALGVPATAWAFCGGGAYPHLPQGPFVDAGSGLVRHVPSQTVWKRCAEGQDWVRNSCVGQPLQLTAAQAQARAVKVNASAPGTRNAGQTSWRLPRVHELRWLVESGCEYPAINQTQFPHTPVLPFWTETPFVNGYNAAWTVDFARGEARGTDRLSKAAVRLVRVAGAVDMKRELTLAAASSRPPVARHRGPTVRAAVPAPISDVIHIGAPQAPPDVPYVTLLPPPGPTCP